MKADKTLEVDNIIYRAYDSKVDIGDKIKDSLEWIFFHFNPNEVLTIINISDKKKLKTSNISVLLSGNQQIKDINTKKVILTYADFLGKEVQKSGEIYLELESSNKYINSFIKSYMDIKFGSVEEVWEVITSSVDFRNFFSNLWENGRKNNEGN